MWIYHNEILHSKRYRVHKDELREIDRAIREEFIIGLNGLSRNMESFFQGSIEQKMKILLNLKMQWLASV